MVWCDQNLDSSADEDSTNTDADTDRERRIIEVIESVIRIFSALPPRAPPNVPESSQASDTVVPINEPCPEPTASAEVGSAEQSSNQKAPSTLTIGNQSRKRPLQRRSITNVVESVIARNKSAGSTVVSHQSNHNDDPLPVHSGMEVETAMAPFDAVNTGSGEGCSNGWSNEEMQRLLDAMKIFGTQDLDRLKDFVKTRSAVEILQFIQSNANTGRIKQASNSPDEKLKEWQDVAQFLLAKKRDFSAPVVKKVLEDKFWEEERKTQEGTAKEWGQNLNFSRIYAHLSSAIDGKAGPQLTLQEKRIVQYLIYDLGNCVRNITNMPDIQEYFSNIMAAYRRNTLISKRSRNSGHASFSEDALSSLNPFCIPKNLLLELPTPNGEGDDANGFGQMEEVSIDDGYQTVSSNITSNNSTMNETDG